MGFKHFTGHIEGLSSTEVEGLPEPHTIPTPTRATIHATTNPANHNRCQNQSHCDVQRMIAAQVLLGTYTLEVYEQWFRVNTSKIPTI